MEGGRHRASLHDLAGAARGPVLAASLDAHLSGASASPVGFLPHAIRTEGGHMPASGTLQKAAARWQDVLVQGESRPARAAWNEVAAHAPPGTCPLCYREMSPRFMKNHQRSAWCLIRAVALRASVSGLAWLPSRYAALLDEHDLPYASAPVSKYDRISQTDFIEGLFTLPEIGAIVMSTKSGKPRDAALRSYAADHLREAVRRQLARVPTFPATGAEAEWPPIWHPGSTRARAA